MLFVLPGGIDTLLTGHVVGIVREHQERIRGPQILDERLEQLTITPGEGAGRNQLERLLELRVALELACRPVALLSEALGLLHRESKQKEVLCARFLADLDVRTVERADGERTVEHEFHVAGTGGFLAGGGDLLGQVGGWINELRILDVEVGEENHLEPASDRRVVVHDFRHPVDEADDELRHQVAGRRLASEDAAA